jgi:hypothetical protein
MPVEECGNMLIMSLAIAQALEHPPATTAPELTSQNIPKTGSFLSLNNYIGNGLDPMYLPSSALSESSLYLNRSSHLLKQWTSYLITYSLIPATQLSTDDFAGWLANQTNLALKGIIGIRAMSEISDRLGDVDGKEYYRNVSERYIKEWEGYAVSRDGGHAKLAYGWYGSWTTLYNLFPDALLGFLDRAPGQEKPDNQKRLGEAGQKPMGPSPNPSPSTESQSPQKRGFVPQHIYDLQSRFYPLVMQRYGLPLDSRHLYTKSDWQFFAAAVASPSTRSQIITAVARWVNETNTDKPFTDLYETEDEGGYADKGDGGQFYARPVVGGHFAALALAKVSGELDD